MTEAVILWIIALFLGICYWRDPKKTIVGKIIVSLCTVALWFPGIIVGLILIAFSTTHTVFFQTLLFIGLCLITAVVLFALFGSLKKKRVWIPLTCAFVILIGTTAAGIAYQNYEDNLPTVGESGNLLYQYRPYKENTKAVSLDEPSALTLTDELPRMDGATALYPIYASFAKAVYPMTTEAEQKIIEDTVVCTTTTEAYQRIVTGEADIIFVAGPSAAQEQFSKDNGVELVYTPIGKEAFVFFVNSKNPIEDITLAQIQGIYSGEITEWSVLGMSGLGEIRAFQRDAGSGSQTALERLMAGKQLMEAPREDVIDGMGGIIDMTADYKNYRNALGYSFRFYSTEMVQNEQIKLLKLNGIAPTLENIENGTYPVASYFYAVTRSDASENTKLLLDWILSEQGQEIIEKVGYTPLS